MEDGKVKELKEDDLENALLLKKGKSIPKMKKKFHHLRGSTSFSNKVKGIILFLTCFCAIIIFICVIIFVITMLFKVSPPKDPLKRAKFLASSKIPLINTHNDLAYKIIELYDDKVPIELHLSKDLSEFEKNILKEHHYSLQTDIPRLKRGYVSGEFWSVYDKCTITGSEAVEKALFQFSLLHEMFDFYQEFSRVSNSNEILKGFRSGKIASLIGVEGGQMINSDLRVLSEFYELGARYMTLTHNCNTKWADSCCDPKGWEHNGLTEFGKEVILEMNKIGIIVDISHVSNKTMEDVLAVTKAPVMFSHSNSYSLCHHERNVRDYIIDKIMDNKGVICVTYCTAFVSEEEKQIQNEYGKKYKGLNYTKKVLEWEENNPTLRASISKVADHIDYINHRIGSDHICIGSDYDGIEFVPLGLEDSSKHIFLIEELIKRGYSDKDVMKIMGENIMRVLSDVEKTSENLKGSSVFH